MNALFRIWYSIQHTLFPWLEEELDPLTEKERQFIQVVSLIDLERHIKPYDWSGIGRKRKERINIAKAFIAKAVYNLETTDLLIQYLHSCKNLTRLCGWENSGSIPSKSTFSRAFAEFSEGNLTQEIHEEMIKEHVGGKIAGHISRDSTAIEAREKPVKKRECKEQSPKRKRGRPCLQQAGA